MAAMPTGNAAEWNHRQRRHDMHSVGIFGNLPQLETERLILRKLNPDDATDVFAYASDPEVTKYLLWDAHKTISDSLAFISAALARYQAGAPAPWGIVLKDEGRVIGTCDYISCNDIHSRAEIGYALARPCWGHGIMTEAVRKILDYGFRVKNFNRVQAVCDVPNVGSARVLEKAGMTFEGILREYMIHHGSPRSVKMFSILKDEWLRPAELA
jgi:ribosomal-protein-alanine N-acetyltransferase